MLVRLLIALLLFARAPNTAYLCDSTSLRLEAIFYDWTCCKLVVQANIQLRLMETVPVYCEGNDSCYDNETWLEDVTHIVELNGIPIEITKEKPAPQFKQGDRVVVRYPVKGRLSLFKGTVNFAADPKAKDESLIMADTSLSPPVDDKPSSEITTTPTNAETPSDEIPSSAKKKPSPTPPSSFSEGVTSSEGVLFTSRKKSSPPSPARRKRPRIENDQEERVRHVPLKKQRKAG